LDKITPGKIISGYFPPINGLCSLRTKIEGSEHKIDEHKVLTDTFLFESVELDACTLQNNKILLGMVLICPACDAYSI